jgi:hypothetical protein
MRRSCDALPKVTAPINTVAANVTTAKSSPRFMGSNREKEAVSRSPTNPRSSSRAGQTTDMVRLNTKTGGVMGELRPMQTKSIRGRLAGLYPPSAVHVCAVHVLLRKHLGVFRKPSCQFLSPSAVHSVLAARPAEHRSPCSMHRTGRRYSPGTNKNTHQPRPTPRRN